MLAVIFMTGPLHVPPFLPSTVNNLSVQVVSEKSFFHHFTSGKTHKKTSCLVGQDSSLVLRVRSAARESSDVIDTDQSVGLAQTLDSYVKSIQSAYPEVLRRGVSKL
jgi:hypothetical protein